MNKIKDEVYKSIRYIIPIVLIFLGIIVIQNYSEILRFIKHNKDIIEGVLMPLKSVQISHNL